MMRYTAVILLVLAVCTTVQAGRWCHSCSYTYHSVFGNMMSCRRGRESSEGMECPPRHQCYALKLRYDKVEADPAARYDIPLGEYTWYFQGCIYEGRDADSYECARRLRGFERSPSLQVGTTNFNCESHVCDGDFCNDARQHFGQIVE